MAMSMYIGRHFGVLAHSGPLASRLVKMKDIQLVLVNQSESMEMLLRKWLNT